MSAALLIRVSSLGDVVQTFPAVSDLRTRVPGWRLHWAVEEAYRPLVELHPGVERALPFALRRWRRTLLRRSAWKEIRAFYRTVRATSYDAVIDAQGLLKSLAIAKMAKGPLHGFGPGTVRESQVARFYDRGYEFDPALHRVWHYRGLFAAVFGYKLDTAPDSIDYGLRAPAKPAAAGGRPYCVLLHGTARAEKLWPEAHWIELGRRLAQRGLACNLPWGDATERTRSEALALAIPGARVMPALALDEAAGLLAHARGVVGVDTGLMHLAVAYKVPVVGIYIATRPGHHGPLGAGPTAFCGGMGNLPTADEVFEAALRVVPD
jgi:heptosyltransferase I